MLPNRLLQAVRSLAKAGGTTLAAVLSLVLGIGSTTLVFSVMDAVVTRPLPCPAPDRLVIVMEKHPERGLMVARPANYWDWRRRTRTIERSAATFAISLEVPGVDGHVAGALVGEGLFETWGVPPRLGRGFVADDYQVPVAPSSFGKQGGVAVVSDGFWKRHFGSDPGILGRDLLLDGAVHTIVGVMPPSFRVIDRSDIWIPWIFTGSDWTERRFHNLPILARLRADVSREDAQREMSAIYESLADAHPENVGWSVELIPPRQLFAGRRSQALIMLLGAVIFVLLIACANVSNLLLVQGLRRQRETALRLALGCSRARLIGQQLLEGAILAGAGLVGGLAFAGAGLQSVSALPVVADMSFAFAPALDGRVLAFTCLVASASALVFAVIPAWSQSRTDPLDSLKAASRTLGRHTGRGLRSLLVTIEVSLGVAVVVLTSLMVQSLERLGDVNAGARTDDVMTFGLEAAANRYPNEVALPLFFDQVMERVRALPGVERVAVGSYLPLTTLRRSWRFAIAGRPATSSGDEYFAVANEVSRDFFSALDIRLVAGRVFDHSDRAGSPAVVVMSETAARRFWPGGSPIGERIKVAGIDVWATVVGGVADVHQDKLDAAPLPALYALHEQSPRRSMTLIVRATGPEDSLVNSVRSAVHAIDAKQPIDRVQSMANLRREVLGEPRLRARLLGFFAASALMLGAVGVFAVTAQLARERQGEIGVRVALGATPAEVVGLVVGDTARPVVAGLIVGTGMGVGLAHAARGLLFGVTPNDPMSFLVAGCGFALVGFLASYVPARTAGRTDPLVVLRQA